MSTNYFHNQNYWCGDFPGGPEIKTPPSNVGGAGLITGWRAKIPHAFDQKNLKSQNIKQNQYCKKFSIKT